MAKDNKAIIGSALIIIAGCFWGSMGIFVRRLDTYGFSSIQIVSIRVTMAALIFALVLFVKDRKGFKISFRDIPLFLGLGFGSILFFTVCYFSAITMMSLSTAAILLYTSPIWIMLMSILFFHEKLDRRKLIALALAFAGCVLVSGISGGGVTPTGLLVGLGSGIGYGLYSILGKIALCKYSPYTVTTYTFVFAAIGSWFICRPADMINKFSDAADPGFLILFQGTCNHETCLERRRGSGDLKDATHDTADRESRHPGIIQVQCKSFRTRYRWDYQQPERGKCTH